jgi:AsmA-like C-terminal region
MFLWGVFLAVTLALLIVGFMYLRFDDVIRRHALQKIASQYKSLSVRVGKARFENGRGILLYDLTVSDPHAVDPSAPVLAIDELFLAGNMTVKDVVSDKLDVERIVVRRPRLHAVHLPNGAWNIQSLLPLPRFGTQAPEIEVEDATLLVGDAVGRDAGQIALRGIDLKLSPLSDAAPASQPANAATSAPRHDRRFHVVGMASSTPAREMKFSGMLNADQATFDLTLDARGLEVTPELIAAMPLNPSATADYLAFKLASIQLFGKADLLLRTWRSATGDAEVGFSADVTLSRGRLEYPALPQPLTDLAFQLHAERGRMFVKQLTAKFGTADIVLACERSGWSASAPTTLNGRIVGLAVDDRLRSALPVGLDHLWQRFRPTGPIDVDAKLTFDGHRLRPDLTAYCRGISLTDAEKFPYPVEQATGTVHLLPAPTGDDAELHIDLNAQGNGQPIHIRADLADLKMPTAVAAANAEPVAKPVISVEVSGSGIAIHERLLAALSERTQRFVRSLAPEGTIDFRWRYERANPAQLDADTSLELRLADCGVQYERFPYPLKHVRGLITAHNGLWTFEQLESRDLPEATATITCAGQFHDLPAGLELQLTFRGANVPLDESLRRALSPQVQKVWSDLRPQGSVDFSASIERHLNDSQPVIQVDLRPHEQTVAVEPTFFPYRFEQIGGRALITATKVELQQLTGRHGRTGFAAQGVWQAAPDGGWQLTLSGLNVDRVNADPEFIAALPPGVQRVIDHLKPTGTIDLFGATLQFTKRPGFEQLASNWDVQLACHQTSLRGDVPLDSLTGGMRCLGQNDGQTCYSYGELAIDSLIWNDAQLTNIHGPFWADSSYCLFGQPATTKLGQSPRRLTADAYGGSIAADIQLQHDGHPHYHVDVSLGGADLRRITSERLGGPRDLTGAVSGKLSLDGAGRSTYALAGTGELHIVDANIYKLPVLVALLKVLSNRSPDTTAFDRCDAQFEIHGEQIHFSHLNLLGDALSLYGRGDTNFDRNLNLTFYSMVGPSGFTVPLLSSMAGQASKQIMQLKVDGSIDNPQIHREAFPVMNQFMQQIQAELQRGVPPGVVEPLTPAAVIPAQASDPWAPQRR